MLGALEKTLELCDRFIDDHPESIYISAIRELKNEATQQIAKYEEMIIDYYKRRSKEEAYQARVKVYEASWKPMLENNEFKAAEKVNHRSPAQFKS